MTPPRSPPRSFPRHPAAPAPYLAFQSLRPTPQAKNGFLNYYSDASKKALLASIDLSKVRRLRAAPRHAAGCR